ncbi:MAG: sensor histidine kinase [Nitrospinota bacterium]|nr:sensor histidine kinase [Nitrospinota bacterium]
MRFLGSLVGSLIVIIILTLKVEAAPSLVLEPDVPSYYMGRHMDILEDKEGKLAFEDVILPPVCRRFIELGADIPNLGVSNSAFWLRTTVVNPSDRPEMMLIEQFTSWIDSLDVYIISGLGEVRTIHSGERFPFFSREFISPHFVFPLELQGGEEVAVYARMEDNEPLQTPFILWRTSEYNAHVQRINLYFGLVFGVMLAVFFYNLFLWITLGDKNYLYYVLYVASITFMVFTYSGYSYQYLWPQNPEFQDWIVFPAGYIAMFFAVGFSKSFLSTHSSLPRIHIFLTVFQTLCIALPLYGLLFGGLSFINRSCIAMAIIFPVMQAFIGVVAYYNDIRSARYFILAWASSIFGTFYTMYSLTGYGQANLVSRHSLEMGLVLDTLLLSFALGDRIKIMRMDMEKAEAKAVETLALSKQQLETMVEQRTAELQKAKEKAEQATALKDKFVGMVSHDLRAPIGSLMNMVKFIKLEDPDTPAVALNEEIVDRVIQSSERLLRLVDNLLNITRLTTGKLEVAIRPVNMRHLVGAHVLAVEFMAREKGILIVNELPGAMNMSVDHELFGEVIANLLSNAIKFCRSGDKVTVFRPEPDKNTIAIRDTGIGIDSSAIKQIFRFDAATSTPGTSGEAGTGLGLPYCHEIMAAHGGMIRAESEKGSGSVFYLELP